MVEDRERRTEGGLMQRVLLDFQSIMEFSFCSLQVYIVNRQGDPSKASRYAVIVRDDWGVSLIAILI